MKKIFHLQSSMQILMLAVFVFLFGGMASGQKIEIVEAKLGAPVPAIPFYHFEAKIRLSQPSIVILKAIFNSDSLRWVDIYPSDYYEQLDMNHPAIYHRPPSADGLSEDENVYKDFYVVGWARWQPSQKYTLKFLVRLKKSVNNAPDDRFVQTSVKLAAPAVKVFDSNWKNYLGVVASETAGEDRQNEPMEILLPAYPDHAKNLKNDLRVVEIDPKTFEPKAVLFQISDIREFLQKDNLEPLKPGDPARTIPLWYPTVTARVNFMGDVSKNSSRVFLVFYNNPKAKALSQDYGLKTKGSIEKGMTVENSIFTAKLHPFSGGLNVLSLNAMPQDSIYHGLETNGAIQWNPDIYSPPAPWTHTSDWVAPFSSVDQGPVALHTNVWGAMRNYYGVEASTKYTFYPNQPYFIYASTMRLKSDINTLALRNAEVVFKRDLFNSVSWMDEISHKVVTFNNLQTMATLGELRMPPDVPWITFYNKDTGIGFAGINLGYDVSGIQNDQRLLNPFFYVTVGPWVYWCRALSVSNLTSYAQSMIPSLAGNNFSEKWAYIMYKVDPNGQPYAPILDWVKKLQNPLKVSVTMEVDPRVSQTINELMSDGPSPWKK